MPLQRFHMNREKITSTRNPGIRSLIKLRKPRNREKEGLFVVEGIRETVMAMEAGFTMHSAFICPELSGGKLPGKIERLTARHPMASEISQNVYEAISYRENHDGIITVFHTRRQKLAGIMLNPDSMIVVLETVEKPGNLGAIARTAEAAGCDALLVCNPQTDIFNPNVIRSSLGCIFKFPVVSCTNQEALEWLKQNNFRIVATWLEASKSVFYSDLTGRVAIVMGSEADGITRFWVKNSTERVLIPMFGRVNSLNVSAATAMMVYECLRQRKK